MTDNHNSGLALLRQAGQFTRPMWAGSKLAALPHPVP